MTETEATVSLDAPVSDLETKVLAWPERAQLMLVTDQLSYEGAAYALLQIKELRKEVSNTFDPIVTKAYSTHKEAVAQRNRHDGPLARAEIILKSAIASHEREQERMRRIEEERINASARKAEEAELRAQAEQAKRAGATEAQQDDILTQPSVRPEVVLPSLVQGVAGVTTRGAWSVEVIDLKALCEAIGAGKASVELVKPNIKVLNQIARAEKQTLNVPGVKVVYETVVSARSW